MEVELPPDLEIKLNLLAAEQGRAVAQVVSEAVERLVDYDTWFMKAVQEGAVHADRGELLPHDEVVHRIEAVLSKL
jgi:predicted transcriptional regulator